MRTTAPRTRRRLGATAVVAGAVLALTGCAGPLAEALGRAPEARTQSYPTGAAAKADGDLPDWVPDDAADVRVVARPGGAERIVAMAADLAALPEECAPVSPDRPLGARPVVAASSDAAGGEAAEDPADFRTVSTLRADWWPVEAEQDATVLCGAWWVGERDGTLYAFTPERRTVPVG